MACFSLFPLVFVSDAKTHGGTNYLFSITMYRGDAAVLAQELRELLLKLPLTIFMTGLFVTAITLAAFREFAWIIATIPAALAAVATFKLPFLQRWLEVRGHATEVAAAVLLYDRNEFGYLVQEAEQMRGNYSGIFAGYSKMQVVDMMRDDLTRAYAFVERWRPYLERFKREVR